MELHLLLNAVFEFHQRQKKIISLIKIKMPDDLLNAKNHHNVQKIIDDEGFAVYLERNQDKVRAKFDGYNKDDDIRKMLWEYLDNIPQLDDIIDDNGTKRKRETICAKRYKSDFDFSAILGDKKIEKG